MKIVKIREKWILIRTRRKFHVFLLRPYPGYTFIMTSSREEYDFVKSFFPDSITPGLLGEDIYPISVLDLLSGLSKISLSEYDGYSLNYFAVPEHLKGTEDVFRELRKQGYRALIGNVIR